CDEEHRELAREPLQRERERALRFDAESEFETSLEAFFGSIACQRFGHEAAHAIEMTERIGSDSARELCARQAEQIAQAAKSHAAQCGDCIVVESARGERYRAERVDERSCVRNRDAIRLCGEHVRSRRGCGRGKRVVEVERGNLETKTPEQRSEAAEESQA